MNDKDIDRLIDRFASGSISPDEQQRLIRHFSSDDSTTVPNDLEQRLSAAVDRLAASEQTRSGLQLKRTCKSRRLKTVLGAAASVAIAVTLGMRFLTIGHTAGQPTPADTFATPEEAYPEVQKTLQIFFSTLDKGIRQIEMVENTTAEAHLKVSAQLNKTNINTLNQKI